MTRLLFIACLAALIVVTVRRSPNVRPSLPRPPVIPTDQDWEDYREWLEAKEKGFPDETQAVEGRAVRETE